MTKNIEYLTWEEFDKAVDSLVSAIVTLDLQPKNIYGIPRGGLVLAVTISHRLDLPLLLDTGKITKSTLVVDDISDTGNTLSRYTGLTTVIIHLTRHSLFIPTVFYKYRIADWVVYPWEKEG